MKILCDQGCLCWFVLPLLVCACVCMDTTGFTGASVCTVTSVAFINVINCEAPEEVDHSCPAYRPH